MKAIGTPNRKKPSPSLNGEKPEPVALGPLEKSIGYALRRAQVAVFADYMTNIGVAGLRPAQFGVLLVVRETPGLKQSVVADRLGIQRTNFVAMVDELQKKGWLDRRPADRRSYALHLTTQGEAKVAETLALHTAMERRIGRLLGPGGKALLLDQLQSIAAALSTIPVDG
jgi:DNA-binding MarR family transcriptional regulator